MKKQTTIIILILWSCGSFAQQLSTSIGRVNTTFDYLNSESLPLDNLHSISQFSYSIGYRMPLSERIFLEGSIVQNNYSNEGSDITLDNYYHWRTNYLGLNMAFEYEFLTMNKFRIMAKGAASPQFLLSGQQTINNQIFSLKGVEQFDSPFLFLRGGIGANYCLDEKVSLSLAYLMGSGSPFSKSPDGETLKLQTGTFSIGLLWGFKQCKYCKSSKLNR